MNVFDYPQRGFSRQAWNQRAFPTSNRPRSAGGIRLLIGVVMALFALCSYFGSSSFNPVTGENQYVSITPEQEIALGLQAAPEMAAQYGGLHPDQRGQALVDAVGRKVVTNSDAAKTGYHFDFHLLADERTVNAFALPGGQIFITAGLLGRLQTEGQLAGILGHEAAHVVARHSAQQIAKQKLTQGLTGAVLLSTYDPNNPASQQTAQIAMVIGQLVNMKYGREDELESDQLGVRFMADAGYDPRSMINVMQILEQAGGGTRQPEFFSTHPNPENRVAHIQQAIEQVFPGGVPAGLIP